MIGDDMTPGESRDIDLGANEQLRRVVDAAVYPNDTLVLAGAVMRERHIAYLGQAIDADDVDEDAELAVVDMVGVLVVQNTLVDVEGDGVTRVFPCAQAMFWEAAEARRIGEQMIREADAILGKAGA